MDGDEFGAPEQSQLTKGAPVGARRPEMTDGNAAPRYRLRHRGPAREGQAGPGSHDRSGPRRAACSPRQPWKAGLRAAVQGPAIAAAADGLTCTQEPAYARGVRVEHRVTLTAAMFRDVEHPGGES